MVRPLILEERQPMPPPARLDTALIAEYLSKILAQIGPNPMTVSSPVDPEEDQEVILVLNVDGVCYTLLRSAPKPPPLPPIPSVDLSPREWEIVRLITRGLPNKAIASILEISPWTVATHLRRVFGKLGVSSRAEMVAKVMKDGYLSRS
jgi:DNA-binding CsgD family transcriptional regulator